MSDLAQRHCRDCRSDTPALTPDGIRPLHAQLTGWRVVGDHHLEKTFKLKDFASALALANRVGEVAEAEQHHPDILVAWGKLVVTIWTHRVDGLTESDFVLAARIDALEGPAPAAG